MGCSSGKPLETVNVSDGVLERPSQNGNDKRTRRESEHSATAPAAPREHDGDFKLESPGPVEIEGDYGPVPISKPVPAGTTTPKSVHKGRFNSGSSNRQSTDHDVVAAWKKRKSSWSDENDNEIYRTTLRDVESVGSDLESEYGKDGIDLASSEVGSSARSRPSRKSTSKSPRRKSIPDGIPVDDSTRPPIVIPTAKKVDFHEETFDPTKLIDVDKFKAANTPRKEKNPDTSVVGNITLRSVTHDQAFKGETLLVTKKSFSEMYDEDDKALMDSIEQDYSMSPHTTLPGALMY